MHRLDMELNRLRQGDPNLANILDVYREIEQVYRQIQEAMGITNENIALEVKNSADAPLILNPDSPTSTVQWKETNL